MEFIKDWFGDIEITERDGGVDIRIVPANNLVLANATEDDDGITVRVRSERMPHIGEQVMVGPDAARKEIVVKSRHWDSEGRLWLVDRDTNGQFLWA